MNTKLHFLLLAFLMHWIAAASAGNMGNSVFVVEGPREVVENLPLLVEVSIHNPLRESIEVDLGHNLVSNFVVEVVDAETKKSHGPVSLSAQGFGRIGKRTLGAGEKYSQRLVVNKWFNTFKPGKYTVNIALKNNSDIQKQFGGSTFSGSLSVSILNKDSEKIRSFCQQYAAKAKQARSVTAIKEAATILSYVNDPVAVPYLVKVFNSKHVAQLEVIEGLRRIQNVDAVNSLFDIRAMSVPDASELAYRALLDIRSGSKDKEIKELINRKM